MPISHQQRGAPIGDVLVDQGTLTREQQRGLEVVQKRDVGNRHAGVLRPGPDERRRREVACIVPPPARRAFAVLDPIKISLSNWNAGAEAGGEVVDGLETFEVPVHPKRPEYGVRKVPFGESLMIDRDDFMEDPVPGFRRLTPGGQVRVA